MPTFVDGRFAGVVCLKAQLRFRRNCQLLILNGQRDERGVNGAHYVRLRRGRFVAISIKTFQADRTRRQRGA